jgi:O-6-methylguanine DNA methyltransferase
MTTSKSLRFGPLTIEIELDESRHLCGITLPKDVPADLDPSTLAKAIAALGKYTPVFEGGAFQQKVWKRMSTIPWGSALTYGELARAVGKPGASRAVGTACAKNRLPLLIPCHRVLAETGLGKFSYGEEWKAKLLELETERLPGG